MVNFDIKIQKQGTNKGDNSAGNDNSRLITNKN
jgi:hypothetical protein